MRLTLHRRSVLYPATVVAILLPLVVPAFAAGRAWSVRYSPARIVNGSPVLIRVTPPEPVTELSGHWLGHDIVFDFDKTTKTWFAIAGASLDTKPGSYSLGLTAKDSNGQPTSFQQAISVQRGRYPHVALKVPDRYTAPSAEQQHEIEEDKKTKEDAFKTVSADREWRGSFSPPVKAQVSEIFGVQRVFNGKVDATHQGLDFRVPSGTAVDAANRGTVILARPLFFEGNCIVIDHGQGLLTLYLHLSKFLVKEGDEVRKGQEIGISGGTGRATGPHLHLAVRWQGEYLNPQTLLALRLP